MFSMTGYGKGVVSSGGKTLTIELKTVNNRFLEINSRLPRSMAALDDIIRRVIQSELNRGSVEVYFNYENQSETERSVKVNLPLAQEYVSAAKKLRAEFCMENDLNTVSLMRFPEVLTVEFTKEDPKELEGLVEEATRLALSELNKMRHAEGETAKKDLTALIGLIVEGLKKITLQAPKIIAEYRVKLGARIKEILQGVELDQTRLAAEAAYFADRVDVNEEISRLSSHINQFITTMDCSGPKGRKLDFISQEINREINTIGSKSNDIELTNTVLAMKNELEKIKEQIRNIE